NYVSAALLYFTPYSHCFCLTTRFLDGHCDHSDLHSFPTRRSSDHHADGLVHLLQQLAHAVYIIRIFVLINCEEGLLDGGLGLVGHVLVGHDDGIGVHRVGLVDLHGHGVGDVDAVVLAALLQLGVAALGGQHAHDLKAVGAHLDVLAYGVAVVGLPGQVVADDADILVLLDVHVL